MGKINHKCFKEVVTCTPWIKKGKQEERTCTSRRVEKPCPKTIVLKPTHIRVCEDGKEPVDLGGGSLECLSSKGRQALMRQLANASGSCQRYRNSIFCPERNIKVKIKK